MSDSKKFPNQKDSASSRKGWVRKFLDWLAQGAEASAASGCAG